MLQHPLSENIIIKIILKIREGLAYIDNTYTKFYLY